ncbi:hypothetical protein ES332_D11G111200v1 [Gossypium tomentosum]|uniref:Uncharacterized protein n=1 Tax=Gossypium tomentosum TaxID=34277 RepID=A0A5D2ILR3_GOSTO|nr:hypothetical protein ES332_D11G111200v1 [Gossypium tomentosum]
MGGSDQHIGAHYPDYFGEIISISNIRATR